MHYTYDKYKDIRRRNIGFTAATAIGGGLVAASGGLTTAGVIAGTAMTAGAVGAGIWGVSQMTKQPKSQTPSIPALPAPPTIDAAETEAKISIDKKRTAAARNKTVYTGPLGLTDEDQSNLASKTMLGE